jgi:crotonobetainyl-CoA:carnitine CoA-transferase CaiB-like acyl-CoA transferase
MALGALAGVTVLDLTTGPAAYTTKLFSDYGAEVIKIEPPGGDPARREGPFAQDDPHPEKSLVFHHYNTNKQSVTLNLETETGRQLLRRLVPQVDILVESFPPGTMDGWGLGYRDLEALNGKLVYVSLTPFGQTGPRAHWKASDITAFSLGGIMYRHGDPEREPMRYPGHVVQLLGATNAAAAAMSAYLGAQLQGEGQHVDISLFECLAGAVDRGLLRYAYTHDSAEREGHRREGTFPSGIYPCADGYIMIGTLGGARGWVRVARMLDMPELLTDPRFATPAERRNHHGDFDAIWYPWLLERTREEIFHKGEAERVMCGIVYTVDEVFNDPQYNVRGAFVDSEHPYIGKMRGIGAPFRMSDTPMQIGRAPLLGEHTAAVLGERLNLGREDLVLLRNAGVI